MKNCYFCGDQYTEQYVVMGGAIGSLVIVAFMIPVEMLRYYISTSMTFFRCQKLPSYLCFRSKLKSIHREMTELMPTASVQYLDGPQRSHQNSSQLIQAHPNFYPIQPTWHQQQGGGHTQQYLLQQQYEMQQNYNLMHQQPPSYKPPQQNYYY